MNLLVLDWSIKHVNLPDGEGLNLRNAFLKCVCILKGTINVNESDHSCKNVNDARFTAVPLKNLSACSI